MIEFIHWVNHLPFIVTWLAQLLACYSGLLICMRLFGKNGIYCFMAVSLIAANIQVNKVSMFPIFNQPIPLGNLIIASTYLSSDMLAEYFGPEAARKGVLLSMLGLIIMFVYAVFTVGFPPLTVHQSIQFGVRNAQTVQNAFFQVFPSFNILILVSLFSYCIAQYIEISIFMFVKLITKNRWLWLRNNASTWLASLVDNIIFNLLAWKILAIYAVSWHTLIFSYILLTYGIRVACAILDTPFIYLGKYMLPSMTLAKQSA